MTDFLHKLMKIWALSGLWPPTAAKQLCTCAVAADTRDQALLSQSDCSGTVGTTECFAWNILGLKKDVFPLLTNVFPSLCLLFGFYESRESRYISGLYNPDWPWTDSSPAPVSEGLRLQVSATTPGSANHFVQLYFVYIFQGFPHGMTVHHFRHNTAPHGANV